MVEEHQFELVENNEKFKRENSFYHSPINIFFSKEELQKVLNGTHCIKLDDNDLDQTMFICVKEDENNVPE